MLHFPFLQELTFREKYLIQRQPQVCSFYFIYLFYAFVDMIYTLCELYYIFTALTVQFSQSILYEVSGFTIAGLSLTCFITYFFTLTYFYYVHFTAV